MNFYRPPISGYVELKLLKVLSPHTARVQDENGKIWNLDLSNRLKHLLIRVLCKDPAAEVIIHVERMKDCILQYAVKTTRRVRWQDTSTFVA